MTHSLHIKKIAYKNGLKKMIRSLHIKKIAIKRP